MIQVGEAAPDFEVDGPAGKRFRLSSLRGRRVILYFFPKAFTSGCTVETRAFARVYPALAENGTEIVGVSVDPPEVQAEFAAHCSTPFPLLGDPTREVARRYGVLSFLGVSKRVTFFLDEEGVVRDSVVSLLPGPHLARTRERFGL